MSEPTPKKLMKSRRKRILHHALAYLVIETRGSEEQKEEAEQHLLAMVLEELNLDPVYVHLLSTILAKEL